MLFYALCFDFAFVMLTILAPSDFLRFSPLRFSSSLPISGGKLVVVYE
jgi:hypothetical protein